MRSKPSVNSVAKQNNLIVKHDMSFQSLTLGNVVGHPPYRIFLAKTRPSACMTFSDALSDNSKLLGNFHHNSNRESFLQRNEKLHSINRYFVFGVKLQDKTTKSFLCCAWTSIFLKNWVNVG